MLTSTGANASPLVCGLWLSMLATTLQTAVAVCPGSRAWIHAWTQVTVRVSGSCSDAMDEMVARVDGQFNKWHDPHNNGTYTILQSSPSQLDLSRLTGDGKYTDLMIFTFEPDGGNHCLLKGCSESQVFSIRDFSTNFCNLYSLYCGSSQRCRWVAHDLSSTRVSVSGSLGAGRDESMCLQVRRRLLLL
mmetsp:Transcript_7986/g.18790  ORF Transcript_7986/g.18790 Transcript_7986/m.18790 type:complete len:189 (-) Transcript_7986:76-642(-)